MKSRKLLSLLLVLVMTVSTLMIGIIPTMAMQSEGMNKILFEKVLTERPWVIHSLVNYDFSDNPYAAAELSTTMPSLTGDLIKNFTNNRLLGALVMALGMGDDAKDYLISEIQDIGALALNMLHIIDDESLISFVDNYTRNGAELRYESVLDAVLTTDYTSSWGTSLLNDKDFLEKIATIEKVLSVSKTVNSFAKSYLKESETAGDYISRDDKTISLLETGYDYIVSGLNSIDGLSIDSRVTDTIENLIPILVTLVSAKNIDYKSLKVIKETKPEKIELFKYCEDNAAKNVAEILSGAGKVLDFSSSLVENFAVLTQLYSMGESVTGVMKRMQSHTEKNDLKTVLGSYSYAYENQVKASIASPQAVFKELVSGKYIESEAIDFAESAVQKIVFEKTGQKTLSMMADQVSRALAIVEIALWLGNKLTNIVDSAKGIYLCLYINEIVAAAINTYKADYDAYSKSRTDENAKKCIDDLEFIKMLRLYSEMNSYSALKDQATSLVSEILTFIDPTKPQESLARNYRLSVDRLIGCSIVDASPLEITVNQNQTLTATVETYRGRDCWKLTLKSGGETVYSIPFNISAFRMSSLTINGGTVSIYGTPGKDEAISFRTVKLNTGKVLIKNASLYTDLIEHVGDSEITISGAGSSLNVTANLYNQGKTMTVYSENTASKANLIRCFNLTNTGTLYMPGINAEVNGSLVNSGNINGEITIIPDSSYKKGQTSPPTISGTGAINTLCIYSDYSEGISVSGTQRISTLFSCMNSRMKNSENIRLTGNCYIEGDRLRCPISLENYTLKQAAVFENKVFAYGDFVIEKPTEISSLIMMYGCNTLDVRAKLKISGMLQQQAGSIINPDNIELYGDLNITNPDLFADSIQLYGKNEQTISAATNIITKRLVINNTSRSGVVINSPLTVSEELDYADNVKITNGENVTLTSAGKIKNETINGSLTLDGVSVKDNLTINGTLNCKNAVTFASDITVKAKAVSQSGSGFSVGSGTQFNCSGDYTQTGYLTNKGVISIGGKASLTGGVNNSGRIDCCDDVTLNGTFSGGTLNIGGDVSSSGAINADVLELCGKMPQIFSASSSTVKTFTISNTSRSGVDIVSPITVTGILSVPDSTKLNLNNVTLSGDAVEIKGNVYNGDLNIKGNYIIPEGDIIRVKGNVSFSSGSLTISDGAGFIADGNITSSSQTLTVGDNASLVTGGNFNALSSAIKAGENSQINIDGDMVMSGTVQTDGEITVSQDSKLTSVTVSGTGGLIFGGDLYTTGCNFNRASLTLRAKIPQSVETNGLALGDITFENTSRSGVSLTGTITYYGALTENSTVITGSLKKGN